MKRFIQNSCSWLAMLFTCVAFAISSSASAQDVTFTLDASANPGSSFQVKTQKGVTISYYQYGGVGNLYSYDWSFNFSSTNGNIVKIKLVTNENLNDIYVATGEWSASSSTWTGSTTNLTIETTGDHYITEAQVWLENGGNGEGGGEEGGNEGGGGDIVKDCSIDVDHFADNCKPGKIETISKWITLYMQANATTTSWTGSSNCPEGVTFTTEAGEEIPIDQFNYWADSEQIGIVLKNEITAVGVYTLHIPEGLVAFVGGKYNKEINAVWTIEADEPSGADTRDVTFDFTTSGFATEVDGVTLDVNGNEYNDAFHGLQVYANSYGSNVKPVTFSVPEGQYITKVVINEAASATNYGLYNMYYYMEYNGANIDISNDYKSITWIGKANTVTFTPYGGSAIFATAIVTVESEGGEIVEPEPEPEPEPEVDLSKLVGDYLFHGVGAYNNDPETEILPEEYYEVSIEAVDGKLHMTGLLGNVYSDPYCYVGTYNTTDNTVTFSVPTYYNYGYVMVTDYDYFLINDSFTLNVVEGEDGSLKFVKEDGWEFLFGWSWYKAGYTGAVELIKDGKIPAEPTGWNGEVLFPEATSIDDLLSCTLEFDGAEVVTASNHDVLGVIYDETGDPYAIAMGNEVYSVFGGVSSEANKVSVNFVKIAELNANLQDSARKAAARIGNFQSGNGSACVAFASKSFKVDGVLVDDVIAHKYEFAGNGTTTGIETIATEGNNATFDLSGRRVVNHANGLYIVGGRKVIK